MEWVENRFEKKKTNKTRLKAYLKPRRVSLGIRKQLSYHFPPVSASNPVYCDCISTPRGLGHLSILQLGCWKQRDIPAPMLCNLLWVHKGQSFLCTWLWAFLCTVMWNTRSKLLFTKLKTRSKMSWCWLWGFLPQELIGHFENQSSSFHRWKLIHIINIEILL